MRKSATAKWMHEQGPCEKYTLARIGDLWGDSKALTPHQIAKLAEHPTDPISLSDVVWGLIQMLSPSERDSFARGEAFRVIDRWEAPDVVRRFLETGDEALRVDARKAAAAADSASYATADDAEYADYTVDADAAADYDEYADYGEYADYTVDASAAAVDAFYAAADAFYAAADAAYAAYAAAYAAASAAADDAYTEIRTAQIERLLEYAE